MGAPNPWGPPNHGGRQSLGTSKLYGHQPFGATEPANLGDLQLGGPRALGAPRPSLVGLVGNLPLPGESYVVFSIVITDITVYGWAMSCSSHHALLLGEVIVRVNVARNVIGGRDDLSFCRRGAVFDVN
jgi:hypothetical protein